jgi:hypothetical protein
VPLLLLGPPFFPNYSFLVNPVNLDDRHVLAPTMASDFTVTWQYSQREQLFFLYGSNSRGPFLTYPLGANFDPRGGVVPLGWSYSLGVKFSVHPSILLSSRECSPLGVNEWVNISPRGQISPQGARGEVKNGPQPHFTFYYL